MADLIDRQAALDALEWTWAGKAAFDALKALPSANAVEVVKCRECRWYKTNYMWNGTEVKICAKEAYEPVRKEDDFCSYGERK